MFGMTWTMRSALTTGDWRTKLLIVSQVAVGAVAAIAILAMLTRDPLWLLGFTAAQVLLLGGVVLFAIVAIVAQRTLVLERFGPGEVIFREGDPGRHVYVIKAGTVEVRARRPGSDDPLLVKRLGPGDHFGEMALLRKAPRTATVQTVTVVEVFRMSPSNFAALYTNLPGLREHFNTLMEARLRELAAHEHQGGRSPTEEGAETSRSSSQGPRA